MTFYAEIPDPALNNSSPIVGNYPPNGFLCVDKCQLLDLNIYDPDGDSLVFMLTTPFGSANTAHSSNGGPTINQSVTFPKPYLHIIWKSPYNLNEIVGGSPLMSIDPVTGIITACLNQLGVYVFAVRIEEYRNGVKIGEIRDELQLQAIGCGINVAPAYEISPTPKALYLVVDTTVLIDQQFCINVIAFDTILDTLGNYDSLYYSLTSELIDNQEFSSAVSFIKDTGDVKRISLPFCWTPVCDDIRVDPYKVIYKVYDLVCGNDTVYLELNIIPSSGDDSPQLILPGGSVIEVEPGEVIDIEILGQDINTTDTLKMWAESVLPDGTVIQGATFRPFETTGGEITENFVWQTDCEHLQTGFPPYHVKYYLVGAGCQSDTVTAEMDFVVKRNFDSFDSLPNIITPNGDEFNEVFSLNYVGDACLDGDFQVTIFDRWGKRVFESNDPSFLWAGKDKQGNDVGEGVYYYMINANLSNVIVNLVFDGAGSISVYR